MSDPHLNNVMVQYFPVGHISSAMLPSEILPGTPPAVVSQTDVENLLRGLYARNKLIGPDLSSTVFNFMLPSGTVLNTDTTPAAQPAGASQAAARRRPNILEDADDSLHGLGGYHGSVHVTTAAGGQDTLHYAVGAFSATLSDGSENGIVAFPQAWKNVVVTFYHELNEARTDPDVDDAIAAGNNPGAAKFLGWMSRQAKNAATGP